MGFDQVEDHRERELLGPFQVLQKERFLSFKAGFSFRICAIQTEFTDRPQTGSPSLRVMEKSLVQQFQKTVEVLSWHPPGVNSQPLIDALVSEQPILSLPLFGPIGRNQAARHPDRVSPSEQAFTLFEKRAQLEMAVGIVNQAVSLLERWERR